VVIDDFNIFRTSICPAEADTPPIVNADAVLTGTITFEDLKVISGWNSQIFNAISNFKLSEFSPCGVLNIYESLDALTF
jgi:hypothetical protein